MSGRGQEPFARFAAVFRKEPQVETDHSGPAAAGTAQAAGPLRKISLDKLFILYILGIYSMNGGVTWRS